MFKRLRPTLLPAAIALLGFLGAGPGALAADDRGWTIAILGATDGTSAQDFEQAVMAAFPAALLDPETNFTRSRAYQAALHYRLVLLFHGDVEIDRESFCRTTADSAQGLIITPHGFGDLTTSTALTAAFCQGDVSLSAADGRFTGAVQPGSLSFQFLVLDVLNQLFPDGYALLPRSRS